MSTDFEKGMASAHYVLDSLAEETAMFRAGYAKSSKSFALVIDVKRDGAQDPDGFDAGLAAAEETQQQLEQRSATFRAGFEAKLQQIANHAVETKAVAVRADAIYAEHKAVKAKADRLVAGRWLGEDGIGLTAKLREAIAVEQRVIEKVVEAQDFEAKVQSKIFAAKIKAGTAEFIDSNGAVFGLGEGPIPAQRKMQRIAYLAGGDTKDAIGLDDPRFETRDVS
jgi:hypothetical protein